MIRSVAALAIAALVLTACMGAPPVNRTSAEPLTTAAQVDLARYVGLWHEAARLPNQFERGCVAATATYTQRPDGMIGVRNACTKADGSVNEVNGRAKVVDAATKAKLKVSFFGPFWGDYWVLDLAPDYSWALVGEGSGRYLWVLTRAEKIDDALKDELIGRLKARGYDTDALYWNPGVAP
jgi:apolipoprotein D and lipocalin family protein